MFKQIVTLFRGQAHEAGAAVAQRHALVILDQQIRDAGAAITAAQRALALALVEDQQEVQRLAMIAARIGGLEAQARAALCGGREELAHLAAEAIAGLEMDRDAALQAQRLMAAEIARLRQVVQEAVRRFAALQRGRRLARVGDAVARVRFDGSALGEAEATLADLHARQAAEAAVLEAPRVEERLSAAGFGGAPRPTAASVLARLRPLAIEQS